MFLLPAFSRAEPVPDSEILGRLRASCVRLPAPVAGRFVCAGETLRAFYERRGYRPAWTEAGRVLPPALALAEALSRAREHGLRPEDYHLEPIRARLARFSSKGPAPAPAEAAELDLFLSDAFLLYGAHLLGGRVDPVTIHPDWVANRRTADVASVLERALATGSIEAELGALSPVHPEYKLLRAALGRLRAVAAAGGWPQLSSGPVLRVGSRGARVRLLRQRLGSEEPEAFGETLEPERFDRELGETLRAAQSRYGLSADGVLGRSTLAALNVPVESRIRQVEVNLERWRWMPQTLGAEHVRVNIARFQLEVREGTKSVLSLAVVVGKPFTRTPVFSSKLTRLVLNPTWNVPESIARKELVSAARNDPNYLLANGFRVFRGWRADAPEVDPSTVDWSALPRDRLELRFRQSPGPANALGRIKFLLPNRFDVYLHDTPSRGLFALRRRAFSHGCIRVEKAEALAAYLLRRQPEWGGGALQAALDRGVQRVVRLSANVPVHLLYETAWVDTEGSLRFGEDLYGRDAPLAAALEAAAPSGR